MEYPFEVSKTLDGWCLLWAGLERDAGHEQTLPDLRRRMCDQARERFGTGSLPEQPPVAAMRRLFRAAGCDPTRYRPSSEALLRRILKGEDLPAIDPLVDVNNCLSIVCAVPCCVMAEGSFAPPLELRSGRQGEAYVSLRGPFRLEGKPLLADTRGPLDCPITGNEKVKVTPETRRAWLVGYMPEDTVEPGAVESALRDILAAAPVATLHRVFTT